MEILVATGFIMVLVMTTAVTMLYHRKKYDYSLSKYVLHKFKSNQTASTITDMIAFNKHIKEQNSI